MTLALLLMLQSCPNLTQIKSWSKTLWGVLLYIITST